LRRTIRGTAAVNAANKNRPTEHEVPAAGQTQAARVMNSFEAVIQSHARRERNARNGYFVSPADQGPWLDLYARTLAAAVHPPRADVQAV